MGLLSVENLSVNYGRVCALQQISLSLDEGHILTVLGANGAGKSSLLRAIIGAVPAVGGRVSFAGADISRAPLRHRIQQGLVLVPEGRQILISLTVEENLLLGASLRKDSTNVWHEIGKIYERFPNLGSRRYMVASCLSGGEQQMLAISRAMLARPRVIMLDEPSLGLSPLLIAQLFDLIREMNKNGLSILLVEQNTAKALAVAHHAIVLELGRTIVSGEPAMLASDSKLREAYLGYTTNPKEIRAVQ